MCNVVKRVQTLILELEIRCPIQLRLGDRVEQSIDRTSDYNSLSPLNSVATYCQIHVRLKHELAASGHFT